jgi:hypothetical protein
MVACQSIKDPRVTTAILTLQLISAYRGSVSASLVLVVLSVPVVTDAYRETRETLVTTGTREQGMTVAPLGCAEDGRANATS